MYSSMDFGKCTMSFFYCYSIIENNFTAPKISRAPPIYSPPSEALATTDLFMVSIVLPYLECLIVGLI